MNDRMGTELTFQMNGECHAMWFCCAVNPRFLGWHLRDLAFKGVYGTLQALCEAHYIDGVLVKGERP